MPAKKLRSSSGKTIAELKTAIMKEERGHQNRIGLIAEGVVFLMDVQLETTNILRQMVEDGVTEKQMLHKMLEILSSGEAQS